MQRRTTIDSATGKATKITLVSDCHQPLSHTTIEGSKPTMQHEPHQYTDQSGNGYCFVCGLKKSHPEANHLNITITRMGPKPTTHPNWPGASIYSVPEPTNPHGETATEWLKQQFEFEYCHECGKDADKHTAVMVLGNWFARCNEPLTEPHVFNPNHNLVCRDCGLGELTGDHGMIPGDGGASGADFSPMYATDGVRAMYDAALHLTDYEQSGPDYRLRDYLREPDA